MSIDLDFLAIDPGSSKCGYARFVGGLSVDRGIVSPEAIQEIISSWAISTIVIGDRTCSEKVLRDMLLGGGLNNIKVWVIDEHMSSSEGRKRFLKENRFGWRRFWPSGLQSPWRPYDDYVAAILGERFLGGNFKRQLWEGNRH